MRRRFRGDIIAIYNYLKGGGGGGGQPLLTGASDRIRKNSLQLHHMGLDYILEKPSSPERVVKH